MEGYTERAESAKITEWDTSYRIAHGDAGAAMHVHRALGPRAPYGLVLSQQHWRLRLS